jgi:large subunit ribosomal protein L35
VPKFKPNGAASKRFKVTKSGRVRSLHAHRKAGAAFASTPIRGSSFRRRHAGMTDVAPADASRIKKMLGR